MLNGIKAGPALTTVLGVIVALAAASGHLTTAQSAALASAATAIGTIVAALHGGKRVDLAVITGAAGVVLTDLTLFNVHLSSGQISAVVSAISVVLGTLMHMTSAEPAKGTPVPPVPSPSG